MKNMLLKLLSSEPLISPAPSSGATSSGAEVFVSQALPIIGWGLLGTFAVILLIAVVTTVLNKVTNRKK